MKLNTAGLGFLFSAKDLASSPLAWLSASARAAQESEVEIARVRALLRSVYGPEEEARVVELIDAGMVRGDAYTRLAAGDKLDANGNWIALPRFSVPDGASIAGAFISPGERTVHEIVDAINARSPTHTARASGDDLVLVEEPFVKPGANGRLVFAKPAAPLGPSGDVRARARAERKRRKKARR